MSDNLHWETIDYLTKTYSRIYLPHFGHVLSQEMRKNRLSKLIRDSRNFDYFRHYLFKCRLKNKCKGIGAGNWLTLSWWKLYLSRAACGMCDKFAFGEVRSAHIITNLLETIIMWAAMILANWPEGPFDRDVNGLRTWSKCFNKEFKEIWKRHQLEYLIVVPWDHEDHRTREPIKKTSEMYWVGKTLNT